MSYVTLALLSTTTWNYAIGTLVIVYMFVAGFSAAVASLNSIQAVIKNYDARNAILPLGLLIGVINVAPLFD